MSICPKCKKEYNERVYKAKGCCSECGEYIKNSVPVKSQYAKTTMQSTKTFKKIDTTSNLESKQKNDGTNIANELDVNCLKRNPKHTVRTKKQETDVFYDEQKPKKTQTVKQQNNISNEQNNTLKQATKEKKPVNAHSEKKKITQTLPQKKNDGPIRTIESQDGKEIKKTSRKKFSIKKWKEERKKANIEKRLEKLECEMEFHFNDDHYYDDIVSIDSILPDIISKAVFIKIVCVIMGLLLVTAFLIYYA